jgi:predicted acylesterase/phospholipase RssA
VATSHLVREISRSEGPHGEAWDLAEAGQLGDGICLSGGGVRAAAFSLGVLQTLQSRRSLLYGPRSATYLSAVSGGSYIAASYVLGAVLVHGALRTLTSPLPFARDRRKRSTS